MKTVPFPMFPRMRQLMMLFMLVGMAGSFSLPTFAASGQPGVAGGSAFQEPTAELCYTLDTSDPKLVLTQDELGVLAGDPYNYTEEQVSEVSAFCADLPSQVLSVDSGNSNQRVSSTDNEVANNEDLHCPDHEGHPGKVEAGSDDELNDVTFEAGTVICIKGGQNNTGQFTVTEEQAGMTAFELLGTGQDVSYYIIYQMPEEPEYGTVVLAKYFCIDDSDTPFVPGDDYDLTACTEGTATFDIFQEGVSVGADLSNLFTTGVVLPVGDYVLVEYAGDTVVLEYPFSIGEDEVLPIVVVNPTEEEPEVGTVIVAKFYCDDDDIDAPVIGDAGEFDDCVAGTAEFDLLDDTLANGGVSVLVEGDDLFAGVELSFGTYYLVEMFEGEWIEMATVVIGPNATELSYTVINPVELEPGLGQVVKYFCADEDITVPVTGDDESDYDDCELATPEQLDGVNFWVYPFGVEDDAIDVDDSALLGDGVVLPLGTHTLVEEFNGVIHELADLTIVAGETTTIVVFNPVADEEITLNIYKLVCSGFSEMHEDGCVESDELDGTSIDFTVSSTIGEETTTVETSLEIEGWEGSAVLTLPLADSYTVCEVVPDGVEEVLFVVPEAEDAEIDENGCVTFSGDGFSGGDIVNVVFWNDMEDEKPVTPEEPEKPEKPQVKPVPKTVTGLPNTGSGMADESSVAPWMLMASAAAVVGTGAILRKERPAA